MISQPSPATSAFVKNGRTGRALLGTTLLAACLVSVSALPAHADIDPTTQRLIELLVKNGVLRKDQADSLLAEAQREANGVTGKPAQDTVKTKSPNTVRVQYVPETVRRQIAAEVKQQVMQQATEEGWAEPNVVPEWVQRVKISGDVRSRVNIVRPDSGNYAYFPDFNSINTSANGYDVNGSAPVPLLNTTKPRQNLQLRARIDVAASIADWISTDIMLATGSDRSPVTITQTLGGASGSGNAGMFQKYSIWLERANIDLHPWASGGMTTGRMPVPFDVSDLMYSSDLNMDGIALRQNFGLFDNLKLKTVGGLFTVYTTAANFGETNAVKSSSRDEYLFAAQTGFDWHRSATAEAIFNLGYFGYVNTQGKESAPCTAPTSFGSCSTDNSLAIYTQGGNTLFAIRNINLTSTTSSSTSQPEYFGMASRFQDIDANMRYIWSRYAPFALIFQGEYIRNLAYDRAALMKLDPVNNLGDNNQYHGGNNAFMLKLTAGHQNLDHLGDYNFSFAYKFLESDSVLDALNDNNFHLGGTNAKGFVLGANVGLGAGTVISANWYSADQITDEPYAVDLFQLDLRAGF